MTALGTGRIRTMTVEQLIAKLKLMPKYWIVEIPDGGHMQDMAPVKDLMVDTDRMIVTLTTY